MTLQSVDDNLLLFIVDEVISEVIHSTHRQPSIPGIVCEVVTEIIRSDGITVSDKEETRHTRDVKKQHDPDPSKKKVLLLSYCQIG